MHQSCCHLAEQKQIAAKLDELLAQVDTIKTRLDAIPILKRFRQSVLAAAVSSKLTEEWRVRTKSATWANHTIDDIFKLIDVVIVDQITRRKKTIPRKEQLPFLVNFTNVKKALGFDFTDMTFLTKEKHEILDVNGTLQIDGDIVITTRGRGYVASYDESVPHDVIRN
ncbi:MAG: hypothetical protein R3F38_03080 [Gammaproteobacteria bacterium]